MDCFEKFSREKLPEKNAFYRYLTTQSISKKVYEHALNVFRSSEMESGGLRWKSVQRVLGNVVTSANVKFWMNGKRCQRKDAFLK